MIAYNMTTKSKKYGSVTLPAASRAGVRGAGVNIDNPTRLALGRNRLVAQDLKAGAIQFDLTKCVSS